MTALAGINQLELAWRALTPDEKRRASYKLDQASRLVRDLYKDVDTRIAAGTLSADRVGDVIVTMVERAMTGRPNVAAVTEVKGPFTDTVRYANPAGGLYLTDEDRAVFQVLGGSGHAFTVDTFPGY